MPAQLPDMHTGQRGRSEGWQLQAAYLVHTYDLPRAAEGMEQLGPKAQGYCVAVTGGEYHHSSPATGYEQTGGQ